MNKTTLKLLFVAGLVSCVLLEVNAKAVAHTWEVNDDDLFQDFRGSYERVARQPLTYGKRKRVTGKGSDTTNYGLFQSPPYRQDLQERK